MSSNVGLGGHGVPTGPGQLGETTGPVSKEKVEEKKTDRLTLRASESHDSTTLGTTSTKRPTGTTPSKLRPTLTPQNRTTLKTATALITGSVKADKVSEERKMAQRQRFTGVSPSYWALTPNGAMVRAAGGRQAKDPGSKGYLTAEGKVFVPGEEAKAAKNKAYAGAKERMEGQLARGEWDKLPENVQKAANEAREAIRELAKDHMNEKLGGNALIAQDKLSGEIHKIAMGEANAAYKKALPEAVEKGRELRAEAAEKTYAAANELLYDPVIKAEPYLDGIALAMASVQANTKKGARKELARLIGGPGSPFQENCIPNTVGKLAQNVRARESIVGCLQAGVGGASSPDASLEASTRLSSELEVKNFGGPQVRESPFFRFKDVLLFRSSHSGEAGNVGMGLEVDESLTTKKRFGSKKPTNQLPAGEDPVKLAKQLEKSGKFKGKQAKLVAQYQVNARVMNRMIKHTRRTADGLRTFAAAKYGVDSKQYAAVSKQIDRMEAEFEKGRNGKEVNWDKVNDAYTELGKVAESMTGVESAFNNAQALRGYVEDGYSQIVERFGEESKEAKVYGKVRDDFAKQAEVIDGELAKRAEGKPFDEGRIASAHKELQRLAGTEAHNVAGDIFHEVKSLRNRARTPEDKNNVEAQWAKIADQLLAFQEEGVPVDFQVVMAAHQKLIAIGKRL